MMALARLSGGCAQVNFACVLEGLKTVDGGGRWQGELSHRGSHFMQRFDRRTISLVMVCAAAVCAGAGLFALHSRAANAQQTKTTPAKAGGSASAAASAKPHASAGQSAGGANDALRFNTL